MVETNEDCQVESQKTAVESPTVKKSDGGVWLLAGFLLALVLSVSFAVVVRWDLLRMKPLTQLPAETTASLGYVWALDHVAIDESGALTIDGWFLKQDGAYYPNVVVVLMDEEGNPYQISTKSTVRTDLTPYFNNGNDYSHAGVHAVTRLKNATSAYGIYFLVTAEDGTEHFISTHKTVQVNSSASTGAVLNVSHILQAPSAEIIDIDAPASLAPGEKGTIKVSVKNTGAEAWSAQDDIRLCFWQDDVDSGQRAYLPAGEAVNPQETITLTYDGFVMPDTAAVQLEAQMLQEGITYFGDRTPIIITRGDK